MFASNLPRVRVRVNGLVVVQPHDATSCGPCPMVFPGPEQDHCAAFDGAELRYIGESPKFYQRLPQCIAAEVRE